MTQSKFVSIVLAAILILLAAVGGAIIVKKRERPSMPRAEDVLPVAVAEINKKMPMMIDAATRLDRVSSAGRVLTYHYTLLQRPAPGETLEQLREDVPAFEETTRRKVCADEKLKALLDLGVTMHYAYVTMAGVQAFDFNVRPVACDYDPPKPSK